MARRFDSSSWPEDNPPMLLVIDGCHFVEKNELCSEALKYLIEYTSKNCNFILTARTMPNVGLQRLFAEDQLTILDAAQLAFTEEETADFLKKLSIVYSDALVQKLWSLVGGWPVAVKLLTVSGSDLRLLEHLDFDEVPSSLRAYVAEEMLRDIDDETLEFMQIASFIDAFCASLMEELTGWDHARVIRMINALITNNACIVDAHRGKSELWYNYYPALASVFSYQAVQKSTLDHREILFQASRWLGRNGKKNLSVMCALKINDFQHISDMILDNWRTMYMEDNLNMLYKWVKCLPHDLMLENPQICAVMSYAALLADDLPYARLCGDVAKRFFTDPKHPFYVEALTLQVFVLVHEGQFNEAREIISNTLLLMPRSDYLLTGSLRLYDVFASPVPDWRFLIEVIQDVIDTAVTYGNPIYLCKLYAFQAQYFTSLGMFSHAFECLKNTLMLSKKAGDAFQIAFVGIHFSRMIAAYYRGKMSEAEFSQREYMSIAKRSFVPWMSSQSYAFQALFKYLHGDTVEAKASIALSMNISPYGLLAVILPLDLLRLFETEMVLQIDSFLEASHEDFGQTIPWKCLYYVQGFLKRDMHLIQELQVFFEALHPDELLNRLRLSILLALYEEVAGNQAAAERWLVNAFEIAEPERITQIFFNDYQYVAPIASRLAQEILDNPFIRDIVLQLSKFAQGEADPVNQIKQEQLTSRETEIAYLLTSDYTAAAIAHRLSISRETVRKHISNIYAKLGAHSRDQFKLLLQ
jgi:LuxR family maltose regulon positive regulatory protein